MTRVLTLPLAARYPQPIANLVALPLAPLLAQLPSSKPKGKAKAKPAAPKVPVPVVNIEDSPPPEPTAIEPPAVEPSQFVPDLAVVHLSPRPHATPESRVLPLSYPEPHAIARVQPSISLPMVVFIGAPDVGVYDNITQVQVATELGLKLRREWLEWRFHSADPSRPKHLFPQPLPTEYPPSPFNSGTNCHKKYDTRELAEAAYESALRSGYKSEFATYIDIALHLVHLVFLHDLTPRMLYEPFFTPAARKVREMKSITNQLCQQNTSANLVVIDGDGDGARSARSSRAVSQAPLPAISLAITQNNIYFKIFQECRESQIDDTFRRHISSSFLWIRLYTASLTTPIPFPTLSRRSEPSVDAFFDLKTDCTATHPFSSTPMSEYPPPPDMSDYLPPPCDEMQDEMQEILRADVAWQYRTRHREIINEKARNRMRRRREAIRQAPSDVQLIHRIRARLYRRTYRAQRLSGQSPVSDSDRSNDPEEDTSAGWSGRGRPGHNEEDIKIAAGMVSVSPHLCC
ncbi:hypothetical protein R3P38DRAFT_2761581 [Favolaschia claudopus]|uniref:Uncharacterized protein n=1 Tax=Favolaschia claudopus TaxID=2862362 RepID=A0AAW0DMN5_9AGAR